MVVECNGQKYCLIDMVGIWWKKNVDYGVEFFGINWVFKVICWVDVVLFVLDVLDGVMEQDLKLVGCIIEDG